MSITNELREWAVNHRAELDMGQLYPAMIECIADRIDAEHEKAMSRAGQLLADAESDRNCYYVNWQDCKQKVLQGNITFDELNARIESLEYELSHCIELPKDADGEYIHIGDVMDGTCPSGKHVNGTVNAIGDGVFWLSNVQFPLKPDYMHHHNAPTVEDVLDEFANRLYEKAAYFDEEHVQKAITEYASKLRLAGDAE